MHDVERLRSIANYQFGENAGDALFSGEVSVIRSKSTGKIKQVFVDDQLVATLRPRDGFLSLSLEGARRLLRAGKGFLVVVSDEAAPFVSAGRSVFAKHVISADPEIRPGDEVLVVDEKRNLLAVGKALLNGEEMVMFKRGVAVKVRRGVGKDEKAKPERG